MTLKNGKEGRFSRVCCVCWRRPRRRREGDTSNMSSLVSLDDSGQRCDSTLVCFYVRRCRQGGTFPSYFITAHDYRHPLYDTIITPTQQPK